MLLNMQRSPTITSAGDLVSDPRRNAALELPSEELTPGRVGSGNLLPLLPAGAAEVADVVGESSLLQRLTS